MPIKRILEEGRTYLPDLNFVGLAIKRESNKDNVAAALESFEFASRRNVDECADLRHLSLVAKRCYLREISLAELVLMIEAHDQRHLQDLHQAPKGHGPTRSDVFACAR